MGSLYATPQLVTDPKTCDWYHTMDLPEIGTVKGGWDLRATIDDYLGRFDFRGKRCLDIGTAGGFLTFEMERRGASEVVSLDLDPNTHDWEVVPYASSSFDVDAEIATMKRHMEGRQRAYWMAHRLLRSKAKVHYGSAYAIPEELGQFDVVLIGMMLPHVRDPFRVLEQATARCTETLIIAQQAPQEELGYAFFMPDAKTFNPPNAWWSMSEACTERMLAVLGFKVVSKTRTEHSCPARGDREECTAIVSRRAA